MSCVLHPSPPPPPYFLFAGGGKSGCGKEKEGEICL